jgi:hypothetical protein
MSTIRRLYFSLRSSVEFFDDPTLVKAGTAIAKVTPRRELAYTSTKPEPWHRRHGKSWPPQVVQVSNTPVSGFWTVRAQPQMGQATRPF